MPPPSRWLGFGLAIAILLLIPSAVLPESDPSMPHIQTRGEVLMLTDELIVVKAADGTSILIPLNKHRALDSTVKVGDRVEVSAAPDYRIISVKRLNP
jgi:hypothetical protein